MENNNITLKQLIKESLLQEGYSEFHELGERLYHTFIGFDNIKSFVKGFMPNQSEQEIENVAEIIYHRVNLK